MSNKDNLDRVLADVNFEHLKDAATEVWRSVHDHPYGATCECPAVSALTHLYQLGYRLLSPEDIEVVQAALALARIYPDETLDLLLERQRRRG